MTEIWKFRLAMIGTIGFTFGGWFTLDTRGIYAADMFIFCIGMLVVLLCFVVAFSIKTDEPHKRFKNCRKIQL